MEDKLKEIFIEAFKEIIRTALGAPVNYKDGEFIIYFRSNLSSIKYTYLASPFFEDFKAAKEKGDNEAYKCLEDMTEYIAKDIDGRCFYYESGKKETDLLEGVSINLEDELVFMPWISFPSDILGKVLVPHSLSGPISKRMAEKNNVTKELVFKEIKKQIKEYGLDVCFIRRLSPLVEYADVNIFSMTKEEPDMIKNAKYLVVAGFHNNASGSAILFVDGILDRISYLYDERMLVTFISSTRALITRIDETSNESIKEIAALSALIGNIYINSLPTFIYERKENKLKLIDE